jgi:membrane-associated phospholipid phosphatase
MLMRVTDHLPCLVRPLVAALLLTFAALLGVNVVLQTQIAVFDVAASREVAGAMTDAGFAVTQLGATHTAYLLTAVALVVLLIARQWHGALTLAVAMVATQLTVNGVKAVVERPRPVANDWVAEAAGSSFPSGHSATSLVLFATVALIGARACRTSQSRAVVITVGAALVAAVGGSRVALGAHYPTDVLGGWLVGAAVVLLSWELAARTLRSAAR